MSTLIVATSFALTLGAYAAFAQGPSDQPTQVGKTFEQDRGTNAPSAGDPFRGRECGRRFPDRQSEEPFSGPEEVFPRDRFEFDDGFGGDEFSGPEEVFPRGRFGFDDEFGTRPFERDFRRDRFRDQGLRQDQFGDQRFDEFGRDREGWRDDIWTRRFSNEGFLRDPFGLHEDFGTRRPDDDGFQRTSLTSIGELDAEFVDTGSDDDTGPTVVE